MSLKIESHVRCSRRKERGQVLPIVALWMVFFLGMAALAIDMGNAYLGSRQLQAATDASALAGATVLPNAGASTSSVTASANLYSAVATSGNKNVYPNLQSVSMLTGYPKVECLTTLTNQGIACNTLSDGAKANAVAVQTQAYVPLYFANLFGFSSIKISAHSTAAMRGASNGPFNVMVILDTTASMSSSDGGSQCSGSRISCALSGIQVLLQDLSPCSSSQSTCGAATNGNVPNPVDQVALMVFPAVTSGTASYGYCSGGSPSSISTKPYATAESPNPYSLTSGPANTYMIVPFSSDYRTSDAATTLNTSSDLVKAVGYAGSGCAGLYPKGGAGTYYAGVIYAAQYALATQLATRPNSQNVIIILSDGDATATETADFASSPLINGNGNGTLKNGSGAYMSNIDECQQAVAAAKYAASQGTTVYSVSYGSEASGCSSDQASQGGTNLAGVNMVNITPCQTMEYIASDSTQFFSDYKGGGGSGTCVSASQPATNLNQIFGQIAADLTHARLIPNSTT